ncbi:MAG: hypothetical protein N2376_08475, partial [Clostridia bacterium]|nr:hypothetical protein [Clostridia bacterium]
STGTISKRLGEELWDWKHVFEPIYALMQDPQAHMLKFLEPRVDFFKKHPYQLREFGDSKE